MANRTTAKQSTASQIGAEPLRISAAELRSRLEAGETLTILDARGEKAWETSQNRIPGSIRVDSEDFEVDPAWPSDRFTVVYSADLHDATSAMVAQQLLEQGFEEVHVLSHGWEGWEKAGGPVETK